MSTPSAVTHDALVRMGASYMRRTMRCSPIAVERRTMATNEIPDIIGWQTQSGHNRVKNNPYYYLDSVLIEVKVSRSDFLRDKTKPHRLGNGVAGIGRYRYYLCPVGLISIEELPQKWGLLIQKGRGIINVKWAEYFDGPDVLARESLVLRSLAQELERMKGLI